MVSAAPKPIPASRDDLRGALQYFLEGTVGTAWDSVAHQQAEQINRLREHADSAISLQKSAADSAVAQVARAEAMAAAARSFSSVESSSPLQAALAQTPLTPWEIQQVESLSQFQLALAAKARLSAALPRRIRSAELDLLQAPAPWPVLANVAATKGTPWLLQPPRGASVVIATYIDVLAPFPRTWLNRAAALLSWRHAPGVRCLVATDDNDVVAAVRALGCEIAMGKVATNSHGGALVRDLLALAATTGPDVPYIAVATSELMIGAGIGDSLLALGDGIAEAGDVSGSELPVVTLRHVQAQGPEGGFDRVLASGGLGISIHALLRIGGVAPDSPVVPPRKEPLMGDSFKSRRPWGAQAGGIAPAVAAGLAVGMPPGPVPTGGPIEANEGHWQEKAGPNSRDRLNALNDAIEGAAARGGLGPPANHEFVAMRNPSYGAALHAAQLGQAIGLHGVASQGTVSAGSSLRMTQEAGSNEALKTASVEGEKEKEQQEQEKVQDNGNTSASITPGVPASEAEPAPTSLSLVATKSEPSPSPKPPVTPAVAAAGAAKAAFAKMPDIAFGRPYWDRLTLSWLLMKSTDVGRPASMVTRHADITLSTVAVLAPPDLHNPKRESWSDILWNRDKIHRGKLGLSSIITGGLSQASQCTVRVDALPNLERPTPAMPDFMAELIERSEARAATESQTWVGLTSQELEAAGQDVSAGSSAPGNSARQLVGDEYGESDTADPPPKSNDGGPGLKAEQKGAAQTLDGPDVSRQSPEPVVISPPALSPSPSPSTSPVPTPTASATPSTSPGWAEIQLKLSEAAMRAEHRKRAILAEEAAAIGLSLEEVIEAKHGHVRAIDNQEFRAQWLSRYSSKGWGGIWGTAKAVAIECSDAKTKYSMPAPEVAQSREEFVESPNKRRIEEAQPRRYAPSAQESSIGRTPPEVGPAVAGRGKQEQEVQAFRSKKKSDNRAKSATADVSSEPPSTTLAAKRERLAKMRRQRKEDVQRRSAAKKKANKS